MAAGSARVRAGEWILTTADRDRTQGALGDRGVEFDADSPGYATTSDIACAPAAQ